MLCNFIPFQPFGRFLGQALSIDIHSQNIVENKMLSKKICHTFMHMNTSFKLKIKVGLTIVLYGYTAASFSVQLLKLLQMIENVTLSWYDAILFS